MVILELQLASGVGVQVSYLKVHYNLFAFSILFDLNSSVIKVSLTNLLKISLIRSITESRSMSRTYANAEDERVTVDGIVGRFLLKGDML